MGNTEVITDILRIVAGHEHKVKERIISDLRERVETIEL